MTELDPAEAETVRRRVEEKYSSSATNRCFWEDVEGDAYLEESRGGEKINDYPYRGKVTLFFDESEEKVMYSMNNMNDLVAVLDECPDIEFYVTNDAYDFLICLNEYDHLIGAGKAKKWVEQLGGKQFRRREGHSQE